MYKCNKICVNMHPRVCSVELVNTNDSLRHSIALSNTIMVMATGSNAHLVLDHYNISEAHPASLACHVQRSNMNLEMLCVDTQALSEH